MTTCEDAPRTITLGPVRVEIRVTAAQSGGALEAFDFVVPPGCPSPGLHTHAACDEHFAVLEGIAEFTIGGARTIARAGHTAIAPRGTPHDWRNAGDATLRVLVTFSPAIGMAAYFADLAALLDDGPPTPDELRALWRRHDIRTP